MQVERTIVRKTSLLFTSFKINCNKPYVKYITCIVISIWGY